MQSSSSDGAPAEGRRRPPPYTGILGENLGRVWRRVRPPSGLFFLHFFLRYFFPFSFFFLEVQTRCIVGAADCVAWASLK